MRPSPGFISSLIISVLVVWTVTLVASAPTVATWNGAPAVDSQKAVVVQQTARSIGAGR